ncbi:hypothetical protein D3C75_1117020 [compost metagenome]
MRHRFTYRLPGIGIPQTCGRVLGSGDDQPVVRAEHGGVDPRFMLHRSTYSLVGIRIPNQSSAIQGGGNEALVIRAEFG